MFIHDTLLARLKRGCETMAYPDGPAPALPDDVIRGTAARYAEALRVLTG